MYIDVSQAREIIGCKANRSIYDYIQAGKLKTDPDSNKVMVDLQSVYALREEKNRNGK